MIAVDTSLISYLILPGEFTAEAERVRALDSEWIAPVLWGSEFRNVLRKYLMAKMITLDEALAFAESAEQLMADRTLTVFSTDVLRLVASSGCTAYDCEFVALAQSLRLPLVTTDVELLRAFRDDAIHPAVFQPHSTQ
jgi:predicted nucleic acid-binding protein